MTRSPHPRLAWDGENTTQAPALDFLMPELHRLRPSRRDNLLRCLHQRVRHFRSTLLSLTAHSARSVLASQARKTAGGVEDRHRTLSASRVMRRNAYSSVLSAQILSNRSMIGPDTRSHCIYPWKNGYVLHWGKYISIDRLTKRGSG